MGSPIHRHPPRATGWEPAAAGDPDTVDAVERHIAEHFGEPAFVWHEMVSDLVHLDVHVVEPSDARPFHTLVTTGMSDRPMTVPDADISPYAELMLCLPADWPVRAEHGNWPVEMLKTVARLPHEYGTWIGAWHSMPNGDPAEPYAPDVPFVGVVVTPVLRCRPEARTIATPDGKEIALLALVPVHPAELDLKLTVGTPALVEAFDRAGVNELLDPRRPSSV